MLKSFVIISFASITVFTSNKFKEFFADDYDNGLNILEINKSKFNLIGERFNINPKHIKAIVFPETIRYNTFRNFLETSSLELLYVESGSETVDFSIGYFQMKPSFIEELETTLSKSNSLKQKYSFVYTYSSKLTEKSRRSIRLKRLKNVDWQITYICCFIDYLSVEYPELKSEETRMIQFYASAYNYGFKKPPESIHKWSKVKAFPYGRAYEGDQFSYSELALHYLGK